MSASNQHNVKKASVFTRCYDRVAAACRYVWTGVWSDPRNNIWTKILKTINLSVRAFFDRELQLRSAALTYSTVLAMVPALALLFAIGRGFGFQSSMQTELYKYFPSQHKALETSLSFVDSYLQQASQGIFVGVGIVFLLWTLYSLLGSIEDTFNKLWGVNKERSLYRKITDYSAICLIVPVLMVCSSGLSFFMSSAVQNVVSLPFLTPLFSVFLDAVPFFLVWVAFTLSFMFIPNTRVKFKYACVSGFICGVAFQLLQILFLNGQIYVSKYNAIYGSFAFLPLLLIWLQLSWLILLFGCILTYSLQNVFTFIYISDTKNISPDFMRQLTVVITAIIFSQSNGEPEPPTIEEIALKNRLPIRLTTQIVEKLKKIGVVYYVVLPDNRCGVIASADKNAFTLGDLFAKLNANGVDNFIPGFKEDYSEVLSMLEDLSIKEISMASDILIKDVAAKLPRAKLS